MLTPGGLAPAPIAPGEWSTQHCSDNLILALQELSQKREQIQAQALKKTVLDDSTAAQFSTAAALAAGKGRATGVDWRDSTLGHVQRRQVRTPDSWCAYMSMMPMLCLCGQNHDRAWVPVSHTPPAVSLAWAPSVAVQCSARCPCSRQCQAGCQRCRHHEGISCCSALDLVSGRHTGC